MANNYDDIFAQQPGEGWREQRKQERDALFGLAEQTALGLNDSANMLQYLDIQARFPSHSVNNALLIAAQMPEATQVRSFDAWKQAGASVQKGEKSISILEPGQPFEGDDGQMHTPYNIRRVFDISQTDAQPVPADTFSERTRLIALVRYTQMPCIYADSVPQGKLAHYDGKQIAVLKGCDAPTSDLFRAIATEMAAAKLGHGFGANCAAYMLCRQHGMEPPALPAIPNAFFSGDPQIIRGELGRIREIAGDIGKRMQRNLEPPAKTDKAVVPE
jgi:hypothetical protein